MSYSLPSFINFTSITGLLVGLLKVFIVIATPIIVFYIIYAGFLYVTARGNAAQIERASRALTYAIVGGVLIIGSVATAQIVANVVSSFAS